MERFREGGYEETRNSDFEKLWFSVCTANYHSVMYISVNVDDFL